MVRQVSGARPRRLKLAIAVNEKIEFSPDEVRQLGASMISYLEALIAVSRPLLESDDAKQSA
jgi:hypothetical protein